LDDTNADAIAHGLIRHAAVRGKSECARELREAVEGKIVKVSTDEDAEAPQLIFEVIGGSEFLSDF